MREPLIFDKKDWMEQAHWLLPGVPQEKLDEMWADVERLDAEHQKKKEG